MEGNWGAKTTSVSPGFWEGRGFWTPEHRAQIDLFSGTAHSPLATPHTIFRRCIRPPRPAPVPTQREPSVGVNYERDGVLLREFDERAPKNEGDYVVIQIQDRSALDPIGINPLRGHPLPILGPRGSKYYGNTVVLDTG